MWTSTTAFLAVLIMPVAAVRQTDWYSTRCVDRTKGIIDAKLREFETIARQYTKTGTPQELRDLIGSMEETAWTRRSSSGSLGMQSLS